MRYRRVVKTIRTISRMQHDRLLFIILGDFLLGWAGGEGWDVIGWGGDVELLENIFIGGGVGEGWHGMGRGRFTLEDYVFFGGGRG